MSPTSIEKDRARLKALLRDLFQFDAADLDFGIYRILNLRRDEIERFIETDLLDAVDEALAQFQQTAVAELEAELQEHQQAFVNSFGPDALDERGEVAEPFRDTPGAAEYLRARRALDAARTTDETRRRIFNDLYRFFSRYYDQGDFLTERRYSSREPKYAIPYNGEEVLLHWANRDQYYVKSTERHTDYRFTAGDCTVWFKLISAQEPNDNVKGDTRYFILSDPVRSGHFSALGAEAPTTNEIVIPFEYRPLSEEEENDYLASYNAQQSKSNRRKTLDRSVLVQAMEVVLLEAIDRPDLKQALARPHGPEPESRSVLGYHLNRYTARNTMDYFVHKDLGGFLHRELDYFLKNEVLQIDDVVGDESGELARHALARMRAVRHIARRVISFLAQIEDFQKWLFEKKKFVVQTDYCVTLDRVPASFYSDILANEAQLNEWRELYAMDRWDEDLFWKGTIDEAFLRNHQYVMVDTRFFDDDFKARLLATFDDIDAETDGLLIHGENFQALNVLTAKFMEQVKCVYLDPPYNSKTSEILYKNTYKHSSWLALMENRLRISRPFSTKDGSHIIAIDENEQERLGLLLEVLFPNHERICVAVRHNKKGIQGDYFSYNHEYAYFCLPPELGQTNEKQIPETEWEYANLRNWGTESERHTAKNCFYPILVKGDEIVGFGDVCPDDFHPGTSNIEREDGVVEVYPVDPRGVERKWRYARSSVPNILSALKVHVTRDGVIQILKAKTTRRSKTMWVDSKYIAGDYGTRVLTEMSLNPGENLYPKSIYTVRDSIYTVSDSQSLTFDFFAGSGTTAHAVIELNREDHGERKYILVEMGDYFHTVLKPRIQKVVFTGEWKDGVPQNPESGVSHMFKYQRLESYEDALNNVIVERPADLAPQLFPEDVRREYVLRYLLHVETRQSPTLAPEDAFDAPFDYQLRIQHGHESPRLTTVDLVETFHYLIGMHVRRLERHEHQGRRYVVSRGSVRTESGIERVAVIWRDTEGLDLEEEARWVNGELLPETPDRVYVNGESFIANAEPLEHTFRNRMLGSS